MWISRSASHRCAIAEAASAFQTAFHSAYLTARRGELVDLVADLEGRRAAGASIMRRSPMEERSSGVTATYTWVVDRVLDAFFEADGLRDQPLLAVAVVHARMSRILDLCAEELRALERGGARGVPFEVTQGKALALTHLRVKVSAVLPRLVGIA